MSRCISRVCTPAGSKTTRNLEAHQKEPIHAPRENYIFTCSWQNLLSSVGFDLFAPASSSFPSRSGCVPAATLTFSSFSGVISPNSQKGQNNSIYKCSITIRVNKTAGTLNLLDQTQVKTRQALLNDANLKTRKALFFLSTEWTLHIYFKPSSCLLFR